MAENLIIRLGSQQSDKVHWLVWSNTEQNIIASGELSNAEQLSQLQEKSLTRQTVVVVPAADIAFKSLQVPAKSKKAMQLAAPFMVEDDLAQEVEQLFFAYGEPKVSEAECNCFMAIVERAQMQSWLAWLEQAGIKTRSIIPDILLLPAADQHWQAITLDNSVLLRQGPWHGLAIDSTLWPSISASWLAEQNQPIDAYSELPQSDAELQINAQPEELPLALLAQQLEQQKFNLLQGEFAVKSERSPLVKTWAWAAGFLLAALLVNVIVKSVTLMQIHDQQLAVEQEIIKQYKAAFPQTKRVRIATIRSQLKRKMSEVGASEAGAEFLSLLAKVQPAFAKVPSLKPDSLRFDSRRNELRLQASANGYQQFEQFKVQLEAQQLEVSQGTQSNQGDKVSGALSIKARNGGRS
ncbi:type II secretion system protein L [Thalassotalea insulae]|uniref:Type II secretion system protein L n=1 Tax=Thalassotalea insulae TaxID=2056778 RepID=A0ABQ6GU99_9GAMM|nr:type II secretion system protein GspL [Thalassotalea insulae]GLX78919.1 type II secretion system protein L [Thalassotalea insulae]